MVDTLALKSSALGPLQFYSSGSHIAFIETVRWRRDGGGEGGGSVSGWLNV